jgi:hypothetical protein
LLPVACHVCTGKAAGRHFPFSANYAVFANIEK